MPEKFKSDNVVSEKFTAFANITNTIQIFEGFTSRKTTDVDGPLASSPDAHVPHGRVPITAYVPSSARASNATVTRRPHKILALLCRSEHVLQARPGRVEAIVRTSRGARNARRWKRRVRRTSTQLFRLSAEAFSMPARRRAARPLTGSAGRESRKAGRSGHGCGGPDEAMSRCGKSILQFRNLRKALGKIDRYPLSVTVSE